MDGASHVTLHCYMRGDGVSVELDNQLVLDPVTQLVPPMPRRQDLILKQVWYEVGFEIRLAFGRLDAPAWPFWTLMPNNSGQHDWRFFGGIRDHSDADNFGLDSTGQLLMSTQGLAQTTLRGAFVLWLEKRDRPNPQLD